VRHKIHTGTDHRIQGRVQFSQVTLEIVDRHYLLKSFLNKRVFFNQKYCLLLLLFDVNIISNRVQCKSQISVKWSICSTIKASRKWASAPNCTSSHTIYLSQIFITFVILQFCNIPRLLSISAMMRKLRRHKQQNNLDYTMNLCHFRTARMKTFEKLKKKKSSWKTETQREQLRAWTIMPNLAKYKALLVGDNYTFLY
jgi:hypothetical protein